MAAEMATPTTKAKAISRRRRQKARSLKGQPQVTSFFPRSAGRLQTTMPREEAKATSPARHRSRSESASSTDTAGGISDSPVKAKALGRHRSRSRDRSEPRQHECAAEAHF